MGSAGYSGGIVPSHSDLEGGELGREEIPRPFQLSAHLPSPPISQTQLEARGQESQPVNISPGGQPLGLRVGFRVEWE